MNVHTHSHTQIPTVYYAFFIFIFIVFYKQAHLEKAVCLAFKWTPIEQVFMAGGPIISLVCNWERNLYIQLSYSYLSNVLS